MWILSIAFQSELFCPNHQFYANVEHFNIWGCMWILSIASLICLCPDDGLLQKPPHAICLCTKKHLMQVVYHSLQHNENEHCQCDKHQLLAASLLTCWVIMDKLKKTKLVVDRFYIALFSTLEQTHCTHM